MIRNAAVVAAVAIVALLGGIWYSTTRVVAACGTGNGVITGGLNAIGGPFTLVDHRGDTVTDTEVLNKPTLLYFGYTFCPDVCPADNARNAIAADILAEQGYDIQPAMISIDPERDTPEAMADFVFNLHEDMIGLTGTPDQVKAASQAYKTYFAKQDDDDPEFYLVDHTIFTYLVIPGAGTMAMFNRDPSAKEVAETTACFIDQSQGN